MICFYSTVVISIKFVVLQGNSGHLLNTILALICVRVEFSSFTSTLEIGNLTLPLLFSPSENTAPNKIKQTRTLE